MADKIHVIRSASNPASAPAEYGQHWINTATNVHFLSKGTSTVADWVEVGEANPAGSDTQVQFNDSGAFGADSLLTFNKYSNTLGVGTATAEAGVDAYAGSPPAVSASGSGVITTFDAGTGIEAFEGANDLRVYSQLGSFYSASSLNLSLADPTNISAQTATQATGTGYLINDVVNYKIYSRYVSSTKFGAGLVASATVTYEVGTADSCTEVNQGAGGYSPAGSTYSYKIYWTYDAGTNYEGGADASVVDENVDTFDVQINWTNPAGTTEGIIFRDIDGGGYVDSKTFSGVASLLDDSTGWSADTLPTTGNTPAQIDVAWTAPTQAVSTGYRVFRDVNAGGYTTYKDVAGVSFSDTGTGWTAGSEAADAIPLVKYTITWDWADVSPIDNYKILKSGGGYSYDASESPVPSTYLDTGVFSGDVVVTPNTSPSLISRGKSRLLQLTTLESSNTTNSASDTYAMLKFKNSDSGGENIIFSENNSVVNTSLVLNNTGTQIRNTTSLGTQFFTALSGGTPIVGIGGAGLGVGLGANTYPSTAKVDLRGGTSSVPTLAVYGSYDGDDSGVMNVYTGSTLLAGFHGSGLLGEHGQLHFFGNGAPSFAPAGTLKFFHNRFPTADKTAGTLECYLTSVNNTAGGGFKVTLRDQGSGGPTFTTPFRIETISGSDTRFGINRPSGNISAALHVQGTTTTAKTMIIQAVTSQTANLLDVQTVGGTSTFTIFSNGKVNIGGSATPTANLLFAAGSTGANTAPMKFTTGSLNTSPEIGAVEFLTDKLYFTIQTGTSRKEFTLNDSALTSGRVPIITTNGRLTDDPDFTFATDTLTVTKIAATTLSGNLTFADAINIVTNGATGTKIGTATSQKIGIWNAAPIVQPTTAVAAATFAANTSGIADDTATFDGYTIGQVVKALRNIGLLA